MSHLRFSVIQLSLYIRLTFIEKPMAILARNTRKIALQGYIDG